MSASRPLRNAPRLIYPVKAALTRADSALWLARTRGRIDESGVRILLYHRVTDERDQLAVRIAAFAEQMAFLADEEFRVVDVREAGRLAVQAHPPTRVVGLTFDDGYADVAEHALPVLERYGFSATVFVATGAADGRARFTWYDEQPPLLSPDDIRSPAGRTLRFESHTVTHPNLTELDHEAARREIADGKRELEEWLEREVDAFCYPAGLFRARDRQLAAEAGFRYAVTCERGKNDASTDPLTLRRHQIDARDALLDFRAKLGGGHDAQSAARAAWRFARYGVRSFAT